MTTKAVGGIVAAIIGFVAICAGGAMFLLGGAASACTMPMPSGAVTVTGPAGGWQPIGRYDSEQVGLAATIVAAGVQMAIPVRGWVIAVATAMQESDLGNPAGGDQDSIGLFQQRPSQGWGTPQQLHDPVYASRKFYEKLRTVPNWQSLPLTEAAQAVQRSAYPDAYAKHENDATLLVNTVVSSGNRAMSLDLEQCLSNCPEILSSPHPQDSAAGPSSDAAGCEWMAPVHAPIVSGFRTAERPGHDGVDLGAVRGTPIHVASSGTVVVVRCNVAPASRGCDQDGSPSTPGCGWYVDILHAGDVVTRYCHMLTRPMVVEGRQVLAGQVIGVVGSSGHSSGPHLHFEVHVNGDRRPSGAVDPVGFMQAKGVPLGR
ncbi:peptidoglycan DD-metalloendopeptidase family protein [Dactylosporangium sp. NPDC049140]|uniref:peptidoglycan DD-metalloendopeptidase family protein n=1 Tax=Dactylosporangium sp. NPDC049140 TaxID=3155647 RepID=UPI0033C09384